MRKFVLAALLAAALIPGVFAASPAQAKDSDDRQRAKIVGLTSDNRLVRFARGNTSPVIIGTITGLVGDTSLVAIDFRVQDGEVYGVGNAGGIYRLNTTTAVATKVSQLTIALVGTSFGVDFNPAANRLRIVSDTGQNLRHNIDDPVGLPPINTTVADAPLTYPPSVIPAIGITAVAYTNNDLDATTGTSLFDIDTNLDQVALQSPANNGFLVPTGALGVNSGLTAGFDIGSTLVAGRSVANEGLATLSVAGLQRLFSIDLLTGQATFLGTFPTATQVVDLTILPKT